MTLKDLRQRARDLDIPGRSRMRKAALAEAVAAHERVKSVRVAPQFDHPQALIAAGLAEDVRLIGDCVLILGDCQRVIPMLGGGI